MKIAFLCSNLESGRDGVGDYTRRLAGELIRQGHPTVVVALNDWHISKTIFELQEIEGTSMSVLRLPSILPWSKRITEARNWLDVFNPDWISLQFVTFGFHQRGLCLGLGKKLAAINSKASWHIMFHELWLGMGEKSPVKHRVLGALQRTFIRDFLHRLQPRSVHTQAEPYRKVLSREKVVASVLPLISNVPYVKGDGWAGLLEPLLAEAIGERPNRTKFYLAGVFGAVHPEWNAEQAVNILLPLVKQFQKRLVLIFLGRSGLTPEAFNELKSTLRNRADVITTGERKGFEISTILQSLDLGLATSPRQIIQKSGSVAAMLEHGLPVLVTRDDWRMRGIDLQPEETSSRLLSPRQFDLLKKLPIRDLQLPAGGSVKQVASQMLAAMKLPLPDLASKQ
jgi:hypothetical protein